MNNVQVYSIQKKFKFVKLKRKQSLLELLVFQIENSNKKTKFGQGPKRPTTSHFGQANFNMSSVTRVVFLTSKVKTI
jgi:hypothetical protein